MCPAQPCLTLAQLRDQFFTFNSEYGWYETAPNGDTALVLLPGTHTLEDHAVFDFYGDSGAFSLAGSHSVTEIIIINVDFWFSFFGDILISHLQFTNGVVVAKSVHLLLVDCVVFSNTWLDVSHVSRVNFTNSKIAATANAPVSYCARAENKYSGVLYIRSNRTSINNVSFSNDHSPCDNPILLNIRGGSLTMADSVFSGKANHIHLYHSSTMNATGAVQFQSGNPAIHALNSPIYLSGTILFSDGNTAIQAVNTHVYLAGNITFESGNEAVRVLNSSATLAGRVSFINNTAYKGAAMYLSGGSRMVINNDTHVVFQGNHADSVGGAIFSTGDDITNYVSSGLRADSCQISFGANGRVDFINNTAGSGGSAMYGITLSRLACGHSPTHF